ncbi:MAG: 4-(cytidine 5'-diphospho)-2-C-methyl-D-erythritol kinase [Bacteroidaceae bacterium]|nr:4-(cytidine 5'-diphospho)-2-C-methyl-D-erythritol kinase [Bacteroidaceae bacterium]
MLRFPNAKINLGLDVVEKRPDGYHNLETIFYPIPLKDVLEITVANEEDAPDYTFAMHNAVFEGDNDDNLVVKAYKILAADHKMPKVKMTLMKCIPTGAGLGGGSADAAFALCMLNEIAGLDLSDEKLEEYAARIGADCAFFIKNEPAYATGIGNILTPSSCNLCGMYMVIVKPEIHISTKEAYAFVRPAHPEVPLTEIAAKSVKEWKGEMKNDFEKSVFAKYPSLENIKKELYSMGAEYASMSGSGSAFFGIFKHEPDIEAIKERFPGMFCWQAQLENPFKK